MNLRWLLLCGGFILCITGVWIGGFFIANDSYNADVLHTAKQELSTVGDVQITFAPNGHIMGIKNKSLKDGHIRNYYFLDKRDKDEISHFYTIKNGLDGVAVFYHCENIIDHVDFYKNNELIYSKKI